MDANIDNKIRTVSFLLQALDAELKELNSIQETGRIIYAIFWDAPRSTAEVQMSKDAFWKLFSNCIIKKVTVDADKTAIKKAIKAGAEVPGAEVIQKLNMTLK